MQPATHIGMLCGCNAERHHERQILDSSPASGLRSRASDLAQEALHGLRSAFTAKL